MDRFAVGDHVVVRYGNEQGQCGTVIKNQLADVYQVKLLDGSILYYCAKGLEMAKERVRHSV